MSLADKLLIKLSQVDCTPWLNKLMLVGQLFDKLSEVKVKILNPQKFYLNKNSLNLISDKKKIKSAGGLITLVAIFLAVLIINQKDVSVIDELPYVADNGRGIASAKVSETNEYYSQWKKKVVTQLAELSEIPSGKISRQPSPLEQLVFGELKGFYMFQMDGSKVKELHLNEKYQSQDIPHYFGNEAAFLNAHSELWWLNFKSLSKEKGTQGLQSVVSLLDSSHHVVGEAIFSWNEDGGLTSLKIEKK